MRQKILAYGHRILQEPCAYMEPDFPRMGELIEDMWETMKDADGCGLAAPQIGLGKRLFIVDSKSTYEYLDEHDRQLYFGEADKGIMETFINAKITERSDELWEDDEGCLSIPGVSQKIKRSRSIVVRYENRNRVPQTKSFSGITARMIQHEYDHIEGILFLDHLQPLARRLIASKLRKIEKGRIPVRYPMKFI